MRKKKKKKIPLTEGSANDPRLNYAITITPADVTIFRSGQGTITQSEFKGMARGEIRHFMNWEEFNGLKHKELALFAQRFGVIIKKGMTKVDVSLSIWEKMIEVGRPYSGVKGPGPMRRGKLANRVYRRVTELTDLELDRREHSTLCPQARVCLEIFLSAGIDEVPEAQMKEMIYEQADKLHTRQDPWRIWQYYRPQLIANRWLTLN